MRLGSDRVIPIDVRIVAATNEDLGTLVAQGASARTCTTGSQNPQP
jgi:transcriptional regulator with GAF, ATPase, and Fis domain